jgi:hypothetical protein
LRLSWCVSGTKGARPVGQARRYGPGNAILLNEFLKEHRKVEEMQNAIALTAQLKQRAAHI